MPKHDGSPTRAELKAERRAHCRSGRTDRRPAKSGRSVALHAEWARLVAAMPDDPEFQVRTAEQRRRYDAQIRDYCRIVKELKGLGELIYDDFYDDHCGR